MPTRYLLLFSSATSAAVSLAVGIGYLTKLCDDEIAMVVFGW